MAHQAKRNRAITVCDVCKKDNGKEVKVYRGISDMSYIALCGDCVHLLEERNPIIHERQHVIVDEPKTSTQQRCVFFDPPADNKEWIKYVYGGQRKND